MNKMKSFLPEILGKEVALEGLDGITFPHLITRLRSQNVIPIQNDHEESEMFQYLWEWAQNADFIDLFQLPEDRKGLIVYDRYAYTDEDGVITEPVDLPEDIHPYALVDEPMSYEERACFFIRGSCATFKTRKEISEKSKALESVQEAFRVFGKDKIVMVASQRKREEAVLGSEFDPLLLETLTAIQWCLLERMGRAREQGQATMGHYSLQFTKETPKTLFYHMKQLKKLGLVRKQYHFQKIRNINVQGSLYHLTQFYVERLSRPQKIILDMVRYLKSCPNSLCLIDDMRAKITQMSTNSLKKLMKQSLCMKCIVGESVPFRQVYPDATAKQWQIKKKKASEEQREKQLRIVKLRNPDIDPDNLWNDDKDQDDDGDDDEGGANENGEPVGILDRSNWLLDRSVMHQAYNCIRNAGPQGMLAPAIGTAMGLNKLDTRTLIRNLERRNVVTSVMVEEGRQRASKFLAKIFEKLDSSCSADFQKEKEKLNTFMESKTKLIESIQEPVEIPTTRKRKLSELEDSKSCPDSGAEEMEPTNNEKNTEKEPQVEVCLMKDAFRMPETKKGRKNKDLKLSPDKAKISTRALKRANSVIELVRQLKVIDDPVKIHRMIVENEIKENYDCRMDKKSLLRLLIRLSKEGQIKNIFMKIQLGQKMKTLHFVCEPNIDEKHSVIQSAVEQAKMKFGIPVKEQKKRDTTNSALKTESVGQSIQEMAELEANLSDPTFKDKKMHYSAKFSRIYGTLPKFLKMREVHILLFYLTKHYEGDTGLDQDEVIESLKLRATLKIDDKVESELRSMKIYHQDPDWKMFMPPLPQHAGWKDGWALMCDVLLRTPLSIFVQVVNITFEIEGLKENYLEHPIRKHYLVRHLPIRLRHQLFHQRKYIFSFYEVVSKLAFIGVLQFGPQKLKEKDQVFMFTNSKATLVDTTTCKFAYNMISTEEIEKFPTKSYRFGDIQDVEKYWYDMFAICVETPLGKNETDPVVLPRPESKDILLKSLLPVSSEEAWERDDGSVPGDKQGAAGFDSSIYAHLKRNWCWSYKPSSQTKSQKQKSFNDSKSGVKVTIETNDSRSKKRKRNHRSPSPKNVTVKSVGKKSNNKPVVKSPPKEKPKRQPYYDEKDKVALGLMRKLRVDWSPQEDSVLLLCKVASTYLNQNSKQQVVHHTWVRDILHEISEKSHNKTSRACQRRINYMMKNPVTAENTSLFIEEVKQNLEVARKFSIPSSSLSKEKNENRLKRDFKPLVMLLYEKHQRAPEESDQLSLPNCIDELRRNYNIVYPKPSEDFYDFENPSNTDDIRASVVNCIITSSLCSASDKQSYAFQLFKIYQQYPDSLLRQVLDKLKGNRMVSLKKNFKKSSVAKSSRLPLSSAPYQLSVTFSHRLLTRYQFDIFNQAWEFLKSLSHRNAIKQGFEVLISQEGGFAASVVELMAIEKILFKVEVPDQLIVLDPKLSDAGEQYTRLLQRYEDLVKLSSSDTEKQNVDAVKTLARRMSGHLAEEEKKSKNKVSEVPTQSDERFESNEIVFLQSEIPTTTTTPVASSSSEKTLVQTAKSASRLNLYMMREEIQDSKNDSADSEKKNVIQHTHDFFVISSCKVKTCLIKSNEADVSAKPESVKVILNRFGLDEKGRSNGSVQLLKRTCVPKDRESIKEFCRKLKNKDNAGLAEMIYDFIADAGELGVSGKDLRNLQQKSKTTKEFEDIVKLLMNDFLIIKTGISTSRFVASEFASPWLLHSYRFTRTLNREKAPKLAQNTVKMFDLDSKSEVHSRRTKTLTKVDESEGVSENSDKIDWNKVEDINVLLRPWIKIDGNLNRRVLDRLLGAILGYVMQKSGLTVPSLTRKFSPALQPMHTFELLEILQELECVTLYKLVKTGRAGLFSSSVISGFQPAGLFDDQEDLFIETEVDAVVKLGQFIGDKQYSADFISQCPCHPDERR